MRRTGKCRFDVHVDDFGLNMYIDRKKVVVSVLAPRALTTS